MKKQFQNIDIQCWEHAKLGITDTCICLQGAAESVDCLLAALDEVAGDGVSPKRTLTLRSNSRKKACSTIRISLSPESDELKEMSLTTMGTIAIFEFTSFGLSLLRDAVIAWRNGTEDFSIQPTGEYLGTKDLQSREVWFWTPFTDP